MGKTLQLVEGYKHVAFAEENDHQLCLITLDKSCQKITESQHALYTRILGKLPQLKDPLIEVGRVFETAEEIQQYLASLKSYYALRHFCEWESEGLVQMWRYQCYGIWKEMKREGLDKMLATNTRLPMDPLFSRLQSFLEQQEALEGIVS